MDFFAAQDQRRRKTKWLVLLYALSLLTITIAVYLVAAIAIGLIGGNHGNRDIGLFNLPLFAVVAGGTCLVIFGASLAKIFELRSGGQHIASQLGGTRVPASTTDLDERKLLNVVEEMALASGISVPPVYILNNEPGINAFAAGYTPADAVIGVNRGTIQQLNRDELQGVIAHEFSHILNGDMRLNIRLIGILFGIQMLTMIGYFVMRAVGTGRRRSRRNNKEGGGMIAILGIAFGLILIGSVGQFFARWIKAMVSRQREYLADASAVQFTRYPNGIGGALKVIGATHGGSKVESPEAEQLSHMFFANSFSSSIFSLFATHPPLVPRIQKLDDSFNGDFKGYLKIRQRIAAARAAKRREEKNQPHVSPLGRMFPPEIAEKFSVDPTLLLAAIGVPNQKDVKRSRALLKSLPEQLSIAAHHPYSARCVAFAMLASEEPTLRAQQLALIDSSEGETTLETTKQLLPILDALPLVYRLPVMEMIQASLADVSHQQYKQFRQTVLGLVEIDHQVSLFEFVVKHHLLMHLDRRFEYQQPPQIRYKNTLQLSQEIELMLSAFASASALGSVLKTQQEPDPADALQAYRLAMQVVELGSAEESNAELRSWEVDQLEACMQKLHQASLPVKKRFLYAAAVLITYDHEITIAESEFFRAVAESLDCPVPILAAGRTQRVAMPD